MSIKMEMAQRLRQFGAEKYGSMADFARALDMDPKDLNSYLSGRIGIGNKMKERLEKKTGCNIVWLITGMNLDPVQAKQRVVIEIEDKKITTFLRSKGITKVEEVEKMFEVYQAIKPYTDKSTWK